MHEPGGERGGEEPPAICVSGLLGVPEAPPPPGMGQQQSLRRLIALAFEAPAAGRGEGKRGSNGVSQGAALGAAPVPSGSKSHWSALRQDRALPWRKALGTPSLPCCSGCRVPGAGRAPQRQSPGTYVPAGLRVAAGQEFAARLGLEPPPSRQLLPLHWHWRWHPAAARGSSCCNAMVRVVPAQILHPQGRRTQRYLHPSAPGRPPP